MHPFHKPTRTTSIALLISLVLWIFFLLVLTGQTNPEWEAKEYLDCILSVPILFVLTYINAFIFTLLTSLLFVFLYLNFSGSHPVLATAGFVFIPVYAVINLFAYGSQCLMIPFLLEHYHPGLMTDHEITRLSEWIQMIPGTILSMVNGMGYVILGIPSIGYGLIFYRQKAPGRIISLLFIANALSCFLGITGMVTQTPVLNQGILVGGILFTLAVPFLIGYFGPKQIHPND